MLLHPSIVVFKLRHRDSGEVARRFHELELLRNPWPDVRRRTLGKTNQCFVFNDERFEYFYHDANNTWANERCIEVSLGLRELSRSDPSRCLEVGNVLSQYRQGPPSWTIVDKYEKGTGVRNIDFLELDEANKFDSLISISTFEHIGWDEYPRDYTGSKTRNAFRKIRSLLSSSGSAFVTVPLGTNPFVDQLMLGPSPPFDRVDFLKRMNWENDWVQIDRTAAANPRYGRWAFGDLRPADRAVPPGLYPWANVLAVGQIRH